MRDNNNNDNNKIGLDPFEKQLEQEIENDEWIPLDPREAEQIKKLLEKAAEKWLEENER